MNFKNVKITHKINLSFLAVLLGVLGMVIFSYYQFDNIGKTFTNYRSLARQSLLMANVTDSLATVRLNALKFRTTGKETAVIAVNNNIKNIIDQKPLIEKLIQFEADQQKLLLLNKKAGDYKKIFAQAVSEQEKRNIYVKELDLLGPKIASSLTKIMQTAYRDNDIVAAYYSGVVQRDMMLGRFYVKNFLVDNLGTDVDQALDAFERTQKGLRKLLSELQNPVRRRLAKSVSKDLIAYKDFFEKIVSVINARNNLYTNGLDKIGPEVMTGYSDIFKSIEKQQNILGPYATKTIKDTIFVMLEIGAGIALLSVVIAFITSRFLSKNFQSITQQMKKLSDGDTSFEILGSDRKDEIGVLAKALEVFKGNKIEADSLKNQIEEERIRQAEIARQEQERQENEAAKDLAIVVEACANGDFSQRIDTSSKRGIFLKLSEGINRIGTITNEGLNEVRNSLDALSNGKLNSRMTGDFKGTFDDIKNSFNNTVVKLNDVVSKIIHTTHSINDASDEISVGSTSLSDRTNQQAASLQETAASMEELTATVQDNSGNAATASNLTSDANSRAIEGGEVVDNVVNAMQNIENSSAKITDIIGVIDQISSQVNLLALNAAVEAARAGEAGRGFAVVASEVRSLAVRSADASADIRALISASTDEVSSGTELVNQASVQLKSIIESVSQVTSIVSDIAVASREQSTSINEINIVVTQLDDMTQKNAALVDKNSSISDTMQRQVNGLSELMSFFTLDNKSNSFGYDDLIKRSA